jgi:hypothetical protein
VCVWGGGGVNTRVNFDDVHARVNHGVLVHSCKRGSQRPAERLNKHTLHEPADFIIMRHWPVRMSHRCAACHRHDQACLSTVGDDHATQSCSNALAQARRGGARTYPVERRVLGESDDRDNITGLWVCLI